MGLQGQTGRVKKGRPPAESSGTRLSSPALFSGVFLADFSSSDQHSTLPSPIRQQHCPVRVAHLRPVSTRHSGAPGYLAWQLEKRQKASLGPVGTLAASHSFFLLPSLNTLWGTWKSVLPRGCSPAGPLTIGHPAQLVPQPNPKLRSHRASDSSLNGSPAMLCLSQQSVRPHPSLPYWGGALSKPCPPLSLGSLNRCHPAASLLLLSPEKGTLPPPRRHAEHRPSFPPIHPLATVPPSLALLPTPAPTTLSHP